MNTYRANEQLSHKGRLIYIGESVDLTPEQAAVLGPAVSLVSEGSDISKLSDEYDRLKNSTDPESQKRFAEVTKELADHVLDATATINNAQGFNSPAQVIGDLVPSISLEGAGGIQSLNDQPIDSSEDAGNAASSSVTDSKPSNKSKKP